MMKDTIKIAKNGHVKMVAHRGVSGLETENTACAFIAAGNRSYYGIETDLYRTTDGKYVCLHDGNTARICDVNLDPRTTTYAEIRALQFRDKDGQTDRAELRICDAYEYQKICRKYGKLCVTELKEKFTADQLREIVAVFGDKMDDVCWISFFMEPLVTMKQLYPDAHCQYLTGAVNDDIIGSVASLGIGIDANYNALTPENIAAAHAAGVEINCWTVDDPDTAARLIDWGVDYITSNILE